MNSIHSRGFLVNFARSRRALVQPRFLLAMTAMAAAVGGVSYLASAQGGRAPVKMRAASTVTKMGSKRVNLLDLPKLVKQAGANGSLAPKSAAKKSGRSARAVVAGPNVSAFNLTDDNLTPNSPSDEREPIFSPDGTLIAFRSTGADSDNDGAIDALNSNGRQHIWVMNSDGTNQRQLTGLEGNPDANRNQFRPSWSPDGNQLVYVDGDGASAQLFVVSAVEGADLTPSRRTFFAGEKRSPAWSPDGLVITFASKSDPISGANLGQFDLYSIDPGGEADTAQRLTGGSDDPGGDTVDDFNPAYSVEDGSIYFSSNRDQTGRISGRRIWRLVEATPALVTDPTQRTGFRAGDTINDDFPTLSVAEDFSPNRGDLTNNNNRILTEQLAFQTNSRLNDGDETLDLNIWGLPTETGSEEMDSAFVLTNGLSSSRTLQPNTNNGGEDIAPDREPAFSRSVVSPQSAGTLAFASQRRTNPNPNATVENPTGGNGTGSTNDIFVTGTVDTTPPTLVPQSIGNQQFLPVVSPTASLAGQGRGNPRTFEAGLRPNAVPGTSGSLKLAVVIDEAESGLNRNSSVVAIIRNADELQVGAPVRDQNGNQIVDENGDPIFRDETSPVNEEVSVTLAREFGYAQTNAYALTAVDDGVSERQADAVAGDGLYYCFADVQTPASGDYYIDIVVTDQKLNTFTFDNIWGFSTRRFAKVGVNSNLLVSDYTVGQRFPNSLAGGIDPVNAGGGGDDGRFVAMLPVESYLIKANGPDEKDDELGIGTPPPNPINPSQQSEANAFPNTDVWRILCRGPVTAALLATYNPTIVSQIDPNETSFEEGRPLTAKTRKVTVASASVTWASPYTGTVFAGQGTLIDGATQTVLTNFSNAGGRLFVMGRDVGFGLTSGGTVNSDFLKNVFGAEWGGDVGTNNGQIITHEVGGFIKPTLSYGFGRTTQDLQNLQVARFIENKPVPTDNRDDAALNLDPNVGVGNGSDGSNTGFGRQAVGVQPDEFRTSNIEGATIERSYSIGGRTVGQRLSRPINAASGATESRSIIFGFGLESINRRYRKPTPGFPDIALNARSNVVRGINSYLKTGSISGRVINASSNQPIANFLVRATLQSNENVIFLARTDNNGFYSIAGLSETSISGGYRVEPAFIDGAGKLLPVGNRTGTTSPSGFFGGTFRNDIEIIGGSNTPGVDFRLTPIVPGSLRGIVVTPDPANTARQIPANGLYVLVRSIGNAGTSPSGGPFVNVVRTRFDGLFSFSGVPALTDLEVILNPALNDIPEDSGLRANFTPPRFTGTFQNPTLERRVITGFDRPESSENSEALQVPSNGTFTLNDSDPDEAADSKIPLVIDLLQGTISGTVKVNGRNTSDVLVELLNSSNRVIRSTRTNANGQYSFANVLSGSYQTRGTTRLGLTGTSARATLNSPTLAGRDILITAPSLSGLVVLKDIGTNGGVRQVNLANARVELLTSAGAALSPAVTTNTGNDGRYSFAVRANSYKVRASFTPGRTTFSSPVSGTVTVRGTTGTTNATTLTITNYNISGQVKSAAGAGVSRAIVELTQNGNTLQNITTDTTGRYRISNIAPGNYIAKGFSGNATGQTSVSISNGATSTPRVDITLRVTGGPAPTPAPTPVDPTDGGGSVGQTFAANQTILISLPYATDNSNGKVVAQEAFSSAFNTFRLYRFDAQNQVNDLRVGKDLKVVGARELLTRGQGYVLETLDTEVSTRTPVQNSNLKSLRPTTFRIPLFWNREFLSDTGATNNLNNGYNLIGFPFNPARYNNVSFIGAKVIYGSKTYNSVSEAAAAGVISNRLSVINDQGQRVAVSSSDIRPFVGYFVRILKNDQPVTLELQNPTPIRN